VKIGQKKSGSDQGWSGTTNPNENSYETVKIQTLFRKNHIFFTILVFFLH